MTMEEELQRLVKWYRSLPKEGGDLQLSEGVIRFVKCPDGCCGDSIDLEMVVEAVEELLEL